MTNTIMDKQEAIKIFEEFDFAEEYDNLIFKINDKIAEEAHKGNRWTKVYLQYSKQSIGYSTSVDYSDKTVFTVMKDLKSANYDHHRGSDILGDYLEIHW